MKKISCVFAVVVISGCAASSGGNYVNSITNLRNISMSRVENHAQTVKLFLENGTQEKAIEAAKQTVANSLKDPSSAQFRDVHLVSYLDGNVICGEVNGKNSYGGYVGFSSFVASTTASDFYDKNSKYPDIQSASNAGITAACMNLPTISSGQSIPHIGKYINLASNEPGKFEWPATGGVVAGYNEVSNKGLNIGGQVGDPVYAAAGGKVVFAGSGLRGYGNFVILKHDNTYLTAYAHNQSLLVVEGQTIAKGQKIAEMGASESDRVKLHFEIRRNGIPVDPTGFLPSR